MRLIKIFSIQLNKLKMIMMWMWIALTTNYIRPGSEVSTATALTPVGSPGRTSRPETVENAEASTINVETANEENSEETVKNVNVHCTWSTVHYVPYGWDLCLWDTRFSQLQESPGSGHRPIHWVQLYIRDQLMMC